MVPFATFTGIAAPLPMANIDTDFILSARFLKTVSRIGLGNGLMYAARFDDQGLERPDFILNREPWRRAKIIVALDNFGCGSSREHAPWALDDFGIRCVIAPSFADIFHNNCFKNGILPIIFAQSLVYELMEKAAQPASATFRVDLLQQKLETCYGSLDFAVDRQQKDRLIRGADDISNTQTFEADISNYETRNKFYTPCLSSLNV